MRRRIGTCLLAILMLAALMVPAMAASDPGIKDLKTTGCTVTPKTKDGSVITAESGFYANAEKLTVQISDAKSGTFYLIMALSGNDKNPTEGNLVYIDQKTGEASFDVYPSAMKNGETYHIYLSSSDAAQTEVASFVYAEGSAAPDGMLGDVDNNGKINAKDARAVLRFASATNPATKDTIIAPEFQERANVNKDSKVGNAKDARLILKCASQPDASKRTPEFFVPYQTP